MKCKRCGTICEEEDDFAGQIDMFYGYSMVLCMACTEDYLLEFMEHMAELSVVDDVLECLVNCEKPDTFILDKIAETSKELHRLRRKVTTEVIKWVRDGNG